MKYLFRSSPTGARSRSTTSSTDGIASADAHSRKKVRVRHQCQCQGRPIHQKRRESLVAMEVPLKRSTTVSTTSCSKNNKTPGPGPGPELAHDTSSSTLSLSLSTYRTSPSTSSALPSVSPPINTSTSTSNTTSSVAPALFLPLTPAPVHLHDNCKDHAFQLVPNIHRELGMLHRDFESVAEATAHFGDTNTSHLKPKLKPLLMVQVEVPGNIRVGRTIFSHPLLVEAIETYFSVIATPLDRMTQDFHATVGANTAPALLNNNITPPSCSKMRGNYVYTRVRILDPLTGWDLVPSVDDLTLSLATLLQAMMDALAMLCPELTMPRYLLNLLEEEQATTQTAALLHKRHIQYRCHTTTTTIICENHMQHHQHHHVSDESARAPVAVFGLEHTSLGEVVFAELEGVLSTQCAWVIPQLSGTSRAVSTAISGKNYSKNNNKNNKAWMADTSTNSNSSTTTMDHYHSLPTPPQRQAAILVSYDPHRLSYCTLAKFAALQHALGRLGRPSCLTFYYTSHEQQVAAQMHTRAHYRQVMDAVDPTNPAQHYYAKNNNNNAVETLRVVPLQQCSVNGEPMHHHESPTRRSGKGIRSKSRSHSSAGSTGSSSEDSSFTPPTDNTKNNSINKTHPGYKVPDYDEVVAHAARKAAQEAEAAKDTPPRYSFVLKTMCCESLQLQCSKPALRESHLRFVPLTPFQATRANQLVYQGKFHLAMKLLSPRQGMVLMHALRSGKPNQYITLINTDATATPATTATAAIESKIPLPATKNKSSSAAKRVPTKTKVVAGKPKLLNKATKDSSETEPARKTASDSFLTEPTRKAAKPLATPNAAIARARRVSTASSEGGSPVLSKGVSKTMSDTASTKPTSSAAQLGKFQRSSISIPSTRRVRRASTTDGIGTVKIFPKQAPRMSLNTETMRESAKRTTEAMRREEAAKESRKPNDPAPPVTTIDTSPVSSSFTAGPVDKLINKTDIVYKDVVDVPILEAWKAFVVVPEGWGLYDEDDDDSYLWGMNDVYSHADDDDRNYYTSDDTYSIGS
jgi:hypothetical protein